jgi:hypothetical protein
MDFFRKLLVGALIFTAIILAALLFAMLPTFACFIIPFSILSYILGDLITGWKL